MARAPITVTHAGYGKFMKTMGDARQSVLPIAKEVLYSEAQSILRESRMEVPFLYGFLSASGRVHEPVIYNNKAMVEISYGGASVDYAFDQHENETWKHAAGRKAFYLRDPVEEARKGFGGRLQRQMQRLLYARGGHQAGQEEQI